MKRSRMALRLSALVTIATVALGMPDDAAARSACINTSYCDGCYMTSGTSNLVTCEQKQPGCNATGAICGNGENCGGRQGLYCIYGQAE
jgi:hypothetical protein